MKSQKGLAERFKLFSFLLIFFLIISVGCAKNVIKNVSDSDEAVLKERVKAYWNHKVKGELDKMYQLEYPLYKKTMSLVKYIRLHSNPLIQYENFEVIDVKKKEDDVADAKLMVNVKLKVPGEKPFEHSTRLDETWMRIDGEWYHVPHKKKSHSQRTN